MPVSTSVFASRAPTQKCRPRQNARWLAAAENARPSSRSVRVTSKVSGSAKRRSSRLAAPIRQVTVEPAATVPPENSTSSLG